MDKFADGFQFCVAGYFFLEEILNGLDVMVGSTLDVFDALCVLLTEGFNDVVEHPPGVSAKGRHFPDTFICRQCL